MPIEQMLIEAAEAMRESGELAFQRPEPIVVQWTAEEILAREG